MQTLVSQPGQVFSLSKRKIKAIIKSPERTAEAVNLVYVSDTEPGITRTKKGNAFIYHYESKKISDTEVLLRIKQLAIPPAWQNVWICEKENGHLQATGTDAKERKQYRYHALWNTLRNETKFFRLHSFGQVLPAIRKRLDRDLSQKGLPLNKVLAAAVSLMERTNIRIGNCFYEKLYGSYGLTTLKDKHVNIKGSTLTFSFKGKKGIYHDISLKSTRLSKIVKHCKDIPGKELFQYYDEDGNRRPIDSGMVNDYIRTISEGDFTAKDFRTWSGTVQALLTFKELGFSETQADIKKNILAALDVVASLLGNSRNVCKKYYVHPLIISLYENNNLNRYLSQLDEKETSGDTTHLTSEEILLMRIMENHH